MGAAVQLPLIRAAWPCCRVPRRETRDPASHAHWGAPGKLRATRGDAAGSAGFRGQKARPAEQLHNRAGSPKLDRAADDGRER
jgi:hypothetical protein